MARGLERPPRWAVAVMVISAAALVVGYPMAANRAGEPLSSGELARMQAAGEAAAASDAAAAEAIVHLTVYGDSYTGGSSVGGTGEANWVAELGRRLPDVQATVSSAGGAGYAAVSPITGQTFVDLVADSPPAPDAEVVIVFGSRNDGADEDAVGEAAAAVCAEIRRAAPEAVLLVIGPPWVDDQVPLDVERNRDAVRDAAVAAGATFVDPLAEGWFFDRPELIGSDGVHPTDEGHAYMAGLIEQALRRTLGL